MVKVRMNLLKKKGAEAPFFWLVVIKGQSIVWWQ